MKTFLLFVFSTWALIAQSQIDPKNIKVTAEDPDTCGLLSIYPTGNGGLTGRGKPVSWEFAAEQIQDYLGSRGADSMDISTLLGQQKEIRILQGSTPLDSVVIYLGGVPTRILSYGVVDDSLCITYSPFENGSASIYTLCVPLSDMGDTDWLKLDGVGIPANADSAKRSGYTLFTGLNGGLPTKIEILKDGYVQFDNEGFSGTRYLLKSNPFQLGGSAFGITQYSAANPYGARNNETFSIGWNPLGGTDGVYLNMESHYRPNINDAYWEIHFPVTDSLGVTRRAQSWTLNKNLSNWNVYSTVDKWALKHVANDAQYARFEWGNGENTVLKLNGTDSGEGMQFNLNTASNWLTLSGIDGLGSNSVFWSNLEGTYANKMRVIDDWGTFQGSNGLATQLWGSEAIVGGGMQKVSTGYGFDIASNVLKADTAELATQHDLTTIVTGDPSVWYESGAIAADNIADEIYHTGDVHIGDAAMSLPGKFNVLSGTSKFYVQDAGPFPLLYIGGSSSSVAGIFRRVTGSASLYFGEDSDSGGTFFRGTGGLTASATVTSGINWAFIKNQATNATTNKARLGLGPHGGYTIAVAPYIESFNVSNNAGLGFGTYNGSLTEKMRIMPDGKVGIGETNPQQTLHVTGTMRLTGSDGTPTAPMGRDADGDVSAMTEGYGINYTGGNVEVDNTVIAPINNPAFTGTVTLPGYTVATLPAGTIGMTAYVTDATAPTFMGTVVGGGAVVAKVFFDGTNWITQ